jgi:hypothetical protein
LPDTAVTVLGQSLTATFTLTGTVGTNWIAMASRTVTDTVIPPDVSGVTCANGLLSATITWTGVAGATNYSVYNGTTLASTTTGTTFTAALNIGAATSVRIVANYPGPFSSTGVEQALVPNLGGLLGGLLGESCP